MIKRERVLALVQLIFLQYVRNVVLGSQDLKFL